MMMKNVNLNTILVPVVLATVQLIQTVHAGSCEEAKLCCSGRDSACVVQKTSPNAIIEGPQDKPCYCDHACLKLGDCCDDFKQTCGVVDCMVSSWGLWSACDSKCGPGTQSRSRTIMTADRNGGKHCPQLEQSRGCQSSDDCQRRNHSVSLKEVALLLPKNLDGVEERADENAISEGYCVAFKVIRATKACGKDPSLQTLSAANHFRRVNLVKGSLQALESKALYTKAGRISLKDWGYSVDITWVVEWLFATKTRGPRKGQERPILSDTEQLPRESFVTNFVIAGCLFCVYQVLRSVYIVKHVPCAVSWIGGAKETGSLMVADGASYHRHIATASGFVP